MATYQQELDLFKIKYKMPKYDLQKTAESVNNLRGANAFLTGDVVANTPANQFIGWVSKTLEIYFKENTQLNENGKYLSSFDAQEFLTDFEDLAEAKYRLEFGDDQAVNREMYAGATLQELNAAFNSICNKINKPLPSLWMEKLKKGSMNIDDLQATTKQAYDSMDKNWNKNENTMAGSLTNVIAGYEAMKQLRDSRKGFFGWFWKLFNWKINAKEDDYFNELSTQVENLKKHFNVDKISSELTGKTVLGKEVKTKEKAKEAPKAKTVKIEPVLIPLNHKRNDVWFKGEFAKKCFRQIPEKAQKTVNELMIRYTMAPVLFERMDIFNDKFDEGIKNGNDPKVEMERIITSIFKVATHVTERYAEDLSNELKLETTKAITKEMVNTLTAAAIYPNELGGFVDEYIEQNAQQYKEIADNFWKEVNRIREKELNNSQEPAFGNDHPFSENNVNKSAPVNQQPQINEIILNKQ